MSNTLYVFIEGDQIPSGSALQESIDRLNLPAALRLYPELRLRTDTGFSPCGLNGAENVGFELFLSPSAEVFGEDDSLKSLVAGRNVCIQMVWRGSFEDCACAMWVSYALVKDFAAIASYQGEPPYSLEELREGTLEALREAENEIQSRMAKKNGVVADAHPAPKRKSWLALLFGR